MPDIIDPARKSKSSNKAISYQKLRTKIICTFWLLILFIKFVHANKAFHHEHLTMNVHAWNNTSLKGSAWTPPELEKFWYARWSRGSVTISAAYSISTVRHVMYIKASVSSNQLNTDRKVKKQEIAESTCISISRAYFVGMFCAFYVQSPLIDQFLLFRTQNVHFPFQHFILENFPIEFQSD